MSHEPSDGPQRAACGDFHDEFTLCTACDSAWPPPPTHDPSAAVERERLRLAEQVRVAEQRAAFGQRADDGVVSLLPHRDVCVVCWGPVPEARRCFVRPVCFACKPAARLTRADPLRDARRSAFTPEASERTWLAGEA